MVVKPFELDISGESQVTGAATMSPLTDRDKAVTFVVVDSLMHRIRLNAFGRTLTTCE